MSFNIQKACACSCHGVGFAFFISQLILRVLRRMQPCKQWYIETFDKRNGRKFFYNDETSNFWLYKKIFVWRVRCRKQLINIIWNIHNELVFRVSNFCGCGGASWSWKQNKKSIAGSLLGPISISAYICVHKGKERRRRRKAKIATEKKTKWEQKLSHWSHRHGKIDDNGRS